MRGDDARGKFDGKVDDPLRLFYAQSVVLRPLEAVTAHVPAERGNLQAMLRKKGFILCLRFRAERIGSKLARRRVDLNPVRPEPGGVRKRLGKRISFHAIRDDSYFHNLLPVIRNAVRTDFSPLIFFF